MKKKCVFLDRDGTINMAPPPGEYILAWSDFRLLPTMVDWIRLFNALGYLVIVITNQRCVARGLLDLKTLAEIHTGMVAGLQEAGARIDDIFFCPHDNHQCGCRKPLPGMIEEAVRKWDIDLEQSLLIGDSDVDRDLATACALRFIRVRDGIIVPAPCSPLV